MTTIGRLAVAVLGNIDDFKKNFGEAKKGIKDFQTTVQKTDFDLKRVGRSLTLVGTAIVGSFTAVTLATAKSAEEIDNLSKRTGISREKLQELAYAVKQEGLNIETFGTNIARLSRNMYDAAQGTGEAKDAFKALGINIKDSNGNLRSSDDVLIDIANRFKNMSNDTERSALAMKLFGRSGADMIPFLRQGGDEIERLKKEARDLGYVLDEETIKQMEQLGDELEAVRTGFAGIGRQVAADAAPALLNIASGAKEFFKWLHLLPDDIRQFITQGALMSGTILLITGGLATLVARIGTLRVALAALNTSFAPFLVGSTIFVGLTALIGIFAKLKEEARLANIEIKNIKTAAEANSVAKYWESRIKELTAQKEAVEADLAGIQKGRERAAKSGIVLPTALNTQKEASNKVLLAYINEQLTEAQKKYNEAIKKETELNQKSITSNIKLQETKFNLNDFMNKLKDSLDAAEKEAATFGTESELAAKKSDILKSAIIELIKNGADPYKTSLGNLVEQYKQYNKTADDITKQIKNQENALSLLNEAQEMAAEMSGEAKTGFEGFIQQLEEAATQDGVLPETRAQIEAIIEKLNELKTISDAAIFKAEIKDNIAEAIKTGFEEGSTRAAVDSFGDYLKNKIYTGVADALADAFMKSKAGQWFTSLINSIFSSFGAITTEIGGSRASGGSVIAGVSYLVGEKGPEIFTPSTSGNITPNDKIGGVNIKEINVINQTGIEASAQVETKIDAEGYIINVFLNAVNTNKGGLRDIIAAARGVI